MNKDELEEMLYAYPFCKAENKNINLELERLEIKGINPIVYDFNPKTSNKTSIVEREVIDREKIRKEMLDKRRKNEILIEKIDNSLEVLSDNEREIIKRIYFKRYKSKDIAQQLYLTYIYVSMLKKSALEKILEIIK